jgi:acyl-coenzyme A synthetase/AMP-(fatty) acid ligase
MHPRRVIFMSELPLTGAGKIDRKALTKQAADIAAAASSVKTTPQQADTT